MRLEDLHWLAKAFVGDKFVDLIYGMGNGVAFIDERWHSTAVPACWRRSRCGSRPPEELIWHRLFISERHRHDMSDVVHLILCSGDMLDWERLVDRVGPHWPLLLAQLQIFSYVYPGLPQQRARLGDGAVDRAARADVGRDEEDADVTRGTLISRFSFAIDVREWGFSDPRGEMVRQARNHPAIREIADPTSGTSAATSASLPASRPRRPQPSPRTRRTIPPDILMDGDMTVLEPLVRDLRYAFRMLRKTPGFTVIALVDPRGRHRRQHRGLHRRQRAAAEAAAVPGPARLATVQRRSRSRREARARTPPSTARRSSPSATTRRRSTPPSASGGFGRRRQSRRQRCRGERRAAPRQRGLLLRARRPALHRPRIHRRRGSHRRAAGRGAQLTVCGRGCSAAIAPSSDAAIKLRGEPYTVVGVMPEGFTTGAPDRRLDADAARRRPVKAAARNYGMIARLRPERHLGSGQRRRSTSSVAGRTRAVPICKDEVTVRCSLVPLQRARDRRDPAAAVDAVGRRRARAAHRLRQHRRTAARARRALRTREIATRMALGSGRRAVIRQLLVESGVLAVGRRRARAGRRLGRARARSSGSAPTSSRSGIPCSSMRACSRSRCSSRSSRACSSASCRRCTRAASTCRRRSPSRARAPSPAGSGRWARRLLVVGEVALGVVLLVSAGLLVRTFVALAQPESRLRSGQRDDRDHLAAGQALRGRRRRSTSCSPTRSTAIRRQPGVEAAGVTLGLPYTRLLNMGFGRVEGATADDKGGMTNVSYVTPGYFEALRLPVRTRTRVHRGRSRRLPAGRRSSTKSSCSATTRARRSSACTSRIAGGGARDCRRRRQRARDVVGTRRRRLAAHHAVRRLRAGDARRPGAFLKLVHIWFSPSWVVRSSGPIAGIRRRRSGSRSRGRSAAARSRRWRAWRTCRRRRSRRSDS